MLLSGVSKETDRRVAPAGQWLSIVEKVNTISNIQFDQPGWLNQNFVPKKKQTIFRSEIKECFFRVFRAPSVFDIAFFQLLVLMSVYSR